MPKMKTAMLYLSAAFGRLRVETRAWLSATTLAHQSAAFGRLRVETTTSQKEAFLAISAAFGRLRVETLNPCTG